MTPDSPTRTCAKCLRPSGYAKLCRRCTDDEGASSERAYPAWTFCPWCGGLKGKHAAGCARLTRDANRSVGLLSELDASKGANTYPSRGTVRAVADPSRLTLPNPPRIVYGSGTFRNLPESDGVRVRNIPHAFSNASGRSQNISRGNEAVGQGGDSADAGDRAPGAKR